LGGVMFFLQGLEVLLQSNFDIGFGHLSLGLKFLDLGRPFLELRLVLFLVRFFQAPENFLPRSFLLILKINIIPSLSTLTRQICVAGFLQDLATRQIGCKIKKLSVVELRKRGPQNHIFLPRCNQGCLLISD
jgi:hypothetical protein